jgi:quercetin dioxygenase-like cupin family protein
MSKIHNHIETSWGGEVTFASTNSYCGKILYFRSGGVYNMHFHDIKDETWLVLEGKFEVHSINTEDASVTVTELSEGKTWRNYPLEPHQLVCKEEGVIVEVSTPEITNDVYHIR